MWLSQLKEQYGISSFPHLLIRFGKEKIRAFSGSLSADELRTLDKYLRIESAGIYIAKQHPEGIRLTKAIDFTKNYSFSTEVGGWKNSEHQELIIDN